jgi:site-specific recombinase XerD
MHHDDVRRHMAPFPGFQCLTLKKLNAGHIRDWMTWAAEKGLSGNRINSIGESMRVAVRYAVSREELDKDPFRNIKEAPEEAKEKGILTPAEVTRLIHAPVKDARRRLAVLLGLLCGLRRGECEAA